MGSKARRAASVLVVLAGVLLSSSAAAAHEPPAESSRTPVVVFPAFHFTKLSVTVNHQVAFPECPASGSFEDWFLNDTSTTFSQVCRDKLMTLIYDHDPAIPMAQRFSEQPGVHVAIKDFGRTESAPYYEPIYEALENAGYVRDKNIGVAGYDSRLTPDQGGFLERTKALIENMYHSNGDAPVHLVGHSNGPFYIQYLLTHTSQAWKNTFIHGFTPLAGNWPGQGLLYTIFFTGFNVTDFSFPTTAANALSSATMYASHPSSYMSAADPTVFGDQEVVIRTRHDESKDYTPADRMELFRDAHLTLAQEIAPYYTGFVKFADEDHFPNVDVYAEKGSGLPTVVGTTLANLDVGQVVDGTDESIFFVRDGDANQEDITNDAIAVWKEMSCFHFELTDNPGVDHFALTDDADVVQRLLDNLQRSRSADGRASRHEGSCHRSLHHPRRGVFHPHR